MAVTTQTLHDGPKTAVMKFTWDTGVAESAVLKVDASALAADPNNGAPCAGVAIEQVMYDVSDAVAVDLIWANINKTAISLLGSGAEDFRGVGPLDNQDMLFTGDIDLTTVGTIGATSRYSILLAMRKTYLRPGYSTYLSLPGEAGDHADSPDSTALSITGDIDLRVRAALTDWTPTGTQTLIAKYVATGNQRSYMLQVVATTGVLRLSWSNDGTTVLTADSTVAPSFVDGQPYWVRATLDVDNGAAGKDVAFYTSPDGSAWSQLGTTVTTGTTTSIFNSTAELQVGAQETSSLMVGKVYRAQVYSGIAGTLAFDANFAAQIAGTTRFRESSANLAIVTIDQSGSPKAEILEA